MLVGDIPLNQHDFYGMAIAFNIWTPCWGTMEFILERVKKLWISYGAGYVGKFCYGFLCGLNHFSAFPKVFSWISLGVRMIDSILNTIKTRYSPTVCMAWGRIHCPCGRKTLLSVRWYTYLLEVQIGSFVISATYTIFCKLEKGM